MGYSRLDWFTRGAPLSRGASRLCLAAGFVAAELYSTLAVFAGHALSAPSVFIFDPATGRHLTSGQVGSLGESFSFGGMIPLLLGTVLTFALAWTLAREAMLRYAVARTPITDPIAIS